MNALGMIELYGYVPAVEALDAALKAANVHLESVAKVKGGLVSVMVTGDVGAVKASIDAASAAAERVGTVIAVHVIPRPASDVQYILGDPEGGGTPPKPNSPAPDPAPDPEPDPTPAPAADEGPEDEIDEETEADSDEFSGLDDLTDERMENMTVVSLRSAARNIGLDSLSKKEIRFAKKDELIEAIRQFRSQER